jgi:N-acylglucosamine 2-epimerase
MLYSEEYNKNKYKRDFVIKIIYYICCINKTIVKTNSSKMKNMRLTELSELYKQELLRNIVPFWLTKSQDTQYGGYFTCLTKEGNVFDTDKFVWLQGRQVWMFSYLYTKVEKRPEWLECAVQGGEFLKKYGHDGHYNWYFSLNREGKPLIAPYNIFSYTFAAMAFGQLAIATGREEYAGIAKKTYDAILSRMSNPKGKWNKTVPGTRELKNFALPMILCNLSLEIEQLLDKETKEETVAACLHEILDVFWRPEIGLIVENVTADGNLSDSFDGRLTNPGHALEAMWFVMDLGVRLQRADLIRQAVEIALRMAEYGWDKQYGGIFYYMDRLGYPPQQLEWDQKLWWVHIEALVCMIKGYQLTGNEDCLKWFEKIHAYTWEHFKDREYPEWFGYLNRQGEVLLPLKGGKWKGCFHVPRGLYQCWKILEDTKEKNH